MECSICYDEINPQLTGKVELSCSHAFHFSCLTTWFSTQATNQLTQSCPCCRHESNPHETMPVNSQHATPMDEESDDSDTSDDEDMFDSILHAAARERAAFRFAKRKSQMSKDVFEAYAASKIAALYRGRCARYIVSEIKDIQDSLKTTTRKYFVQKRNIRFDKKALAFSMKALTMSYSAWRNHVASIIQGAWRSHYRASSMKREVHVTDTTLTVSLRV